LLYKYQTKIIYGLLLMMMIFLYDKPGKYDLFFLIFI